MTIFIDLCLPLVPLNSNLSYLLKPLAVFHSFPQYFAGSLDCVPCLPLSCLFLRSSLRNYYDLSAHGSGPYDAIWSLIRGVDHTRPKPRAHLLYRVFPPWTTKLWLGSTHGGAQPDRAATRPLTVPWIIKPPLGDCRHSVPRSTTWLTNT